MTDTHVVILAAGQGTRMKSQLPKVLHPIAGRPMIEHVLRTADVGLAGDDHRDRRPSGRCRPGAPGGSGRRSSSRSRSRSWEPRTRFSRRSRCWPDGRARVVLLSGRRAAAAAATTLQRLVETHRGASAAATVVTATVERPYGYGRIVRTDGRIARIVEERDASPDGAADQAKSTAGSTPSTWRRCSTRCAASPRRTPRASST